MTFPRLINRFPALPVLLAIGLFTFGLPANAQPTGEGMTSPTVTALDDSTYEKAAGLISGRDIILETRLENLNAQFSEILAAVPRFQKMEQQYPGLPRAIANEMDSLVIKQLGVRIDRFIALLAPELRADFRDEEITSIIAFFESDVGRELTYATENSTDFSKIAVEVAKQGVIATGASSRFQKESALLALSNLDEADDAVLRDFFDSPAGSKLISFYPKYQAILDQVNRNASGSLPESEMKAATDRAVQKYFRGK